MLVVGQPTWDPIKPVAKYKWSPQMPIWDPGYVSGSSFYGADAE